MLPPHHLWWFQCFIIIIFTATPQCIASAQFVVDIFKYYTFKNLAVSRRADLSPARGRPSVKSSTSKCSSLPHRFSSPARTSSLSRVETKPALPRPSPILSITPRLTRTSPVLSVDKPKMKSPILSVNSPVKTDSLSMGACSGSNRAGGEGQPEYNVVQRDHMDITEQVQRFWPVILVPSA